MPKKKPASPASDAQDLQDLVKAVVAGGPRGTLTRISEQAEMKVSAMSRRLKKKHSAFDLATLRTLIMMIALKNDQPPSPNATRHGNYLIDVIDGEPRWSPADEQP